MIEYQFKEEKDFAISCAKELDRPVVLSILNRGFVETKEEARELSVFFWDMVDKTIEFEQQGTLKHWNADSKFWTEKLLQTFSGHLEAVGYSDIWDDEVDKQ
jgi:hypothetical protein